MNTYNLKRALKPYSMAILSVFIAVFSINAVSLIAMAGKSEIAKELDGVGLNGMSVTAYNSSKENITDINLYNLLYQCEDIDLLTPVLYEKGKIEFNSGKKSTVMCWGISPMAEFIVHLDRVHGRMLTQNDIEAAKDVCLIDENIALEMYGRSDITGKQLYLTVGGSTRQFNIIGIVNKTSDILNSMNTDTLPYFVYIPYSTMESMCYKNTVDQILINVIDENITEENIERYIQECRRIPEDINFKIKNLSRQREAITGIVDTAFLALFAVSCVAVIVCSISVASSVNTAVVNAKHDIGIKISLGAGRLTIMAEFMFYSLTACVIGTAAGTLCGYIMLSAVNLLLKTTYTFDYVLLISGIFVTILLTILFSAYPSFKASGLSPIQALNRE